MEIRITGLSSGYEIEHLARVFFPSAPVRVTASTKGEVVAARMGARHMMVGIRWQDKCVVRRTVVPPTDIPDKHTLSRLLYDLLCEVTGTRPSWGMLTGVRPVRLLYRNLAARGEEGAKAYLQGEFDVSDEKYDLARRIVHVQQPVLKQTRPESYSLYVSIPFCPTRCAYCSFVSRTTEREGQWVQPYLDALEKELLATAQLAQSCGLYLETVYIGGGTPTAISAPQLERLLQQVTTIFDVKSAREFTVEAGRPDCTDYEKLAILKQYGVGRISINPQTMQQNVLDAIGRKHTPEDILRCFADARKAGHTCINMDLIAGLPQDTPAQFADTLDTVLHLQPENITLHTLTMKRASNLVVDHRTDTASPPAQMLAIAQRRFEQSGYLPYYLYRQKGTVDNLENIGWCQPGTEGLYNIAIMEEVHTILATGAGASTKLVAGGGQKIQRIYNHKFPQDYVQELDTIINKKEEVRSFYASYMDT